MASEAIKTRDYTRVSYPEPHFARTREIIKRYPQMAKLFGKEPSTAFFVVAIVALQTCIAFALMGAPWWAVLVTAYFVGAVANHSLWTLIHDCTHNLVFKKPWGNCLLQIVANFPITFPGSSMSFRKYHIMHHRYQGELGRDADLPGEFEARLAGNKPWGKALWLFGFAGFQGFRVPRLKKYIQLYDNWFALNVVAASLYLLAILALAGWGSLIYLFLSSIFAIGLHPLGARWIQEHYLVAPPQETYSYYGAANIVAFNVGYHNEHHDFMAVPWSRLPKVRDMAPEYYNGLHYHTSWTALLFKFLFDPRLSLYSRVVRPDGLQQGVIRSSINVQPHAEAQGPKLDEFDEDKSAA